MIRVHRNTSIRQILEPLGDEEDGSENREGEQREDEDPLASTKELHQWLLRVSTPPSNRTFHLGFLRSQNNSMLRLQETAAIKEQKNQSLVQKRRRRKRNEKARVFR